MRGRWYNGRDIIWGYEMYAGYLQTWPLPENLAYNNATYQSAAMGGFPLGDLNWYPEQKADWEAQKDNEWAAINAMLDGVNAIEKLPGKVPSEYVLNQNYPNPFNPTTTIEYSVPTSGHVSLKVFNTVGQEVYTLYNDFQRAGSYKATFDGTELASGVYVYQLHSNNVTLTKKFILLK
jgi:hypothetical protein